MNQPDRYSRFVLPSGIDSAVTYKQDTKMKGAGQFDIWLEDHTLGNLLRQQLLTNPEVGVLMVLGQRCWHRQHYKLSALWYSGPSSLLPICGASWTISSEPCQATRSESCQAGW